MARRDAKPPAPADPDKLKRERAGTYRSADGRFTVEQSSSGWLVLDTEQVNELGLPLARGPFGTLDEAREAMAGARSGPTPTSGLEPRAARRRPALIGPAAKERGRTTTAAKRPNPAALVIREIRAVDGDALRALWAEAGFRTAAGDDDPGLARLARRNPGLVLVATESGRIIGSALGAWDGRRGWIYHLATAASHRRRGIATRLVDQVESGLRDLGCLEVRANIGEGRTEATAFWRARGYEQRPTRQYARSLGAD